MGNDRFTQKAENALNDSLRVAERLGASYIGTEHILLSLSEAKGSIASKLLLEAGVNPDQITEAICECEGLYKKSKLSVKNMTPRARRVLDNAAKNALKYGAYRIGTEHILISILEEKETVGVKLLTYLGVDLSVLRDKTRQKMRDCEKAFGRSDEGEKKARAELTVLLKYGKCLTDASNEYPWQIVGRDNIIDRLVRTLCRKTKNNPVLLGEAGVGKTAIVEGLAVKIIKGEVPDSLLDAVIVSLDLTKIVAGTKYRGDFEERIRQILDECKRNPQIVLFIDELHTVVGTGAAEGAVDLANIIKPELSRGQIRVIGATTLDEYRRHIEKDSALERRFQPIRVDEPSIEDSCLMVRSIAPTFEKHHHVRVDESAIVASVELSTRYLFLRHRPDKCIDLLDEACAYVSVTQNSEHGGIVPRVTRQELIEVIEEFSGVKDANMRTPLSRDAIYRFLSTECIGQHEACAALSDGVMRSISGVGDPARPLGTYFFYGESGVGKTRMARALAKMLFSDENACICFDMSEFSEPHSVSRLIGAPQGYVGYGEGGALTEAVKKHPYSVLLFDEIEKAHRDIYHLFLQILDEGRVSDGSGRQVNFRNTYIIFTSNIKDGNIQGGGIGFVGEIGNDNQRRLDMLKRHFPAEFLARMDAYIQFKHLEYDDLKSICKMELGALIERLNVGEVHLEYDEALVEHFLCGVEALHLGARPIKSRIRSELEGKIAEYMIDHKGEQRLYATLRDGGVAVESESSVYSVSCV